MEESNFASREKRWGGVEWGVGRYGDKAGILVVLLQLLRDLHTSTRANMRTRKYKGSK